jgi:hypothetical protein
VQTSSTLGEKGCLVLRPDEKGETMRVRVLTIFALGAITALLAFPTTGVAQQAKPLAPYSPEWLARYHSMYDNQLTAEYESQMRYGVPAGTLPGGAATAPDALAVTNVRMSNPAFAGNQNEFQIDINPRNHRFAIGASNDGRTSGTGYYRTTDAGQTWTAGDMPGIGAACCDPGVAYAPDGSAYFINLDTSPAVFHVTKTTDNGATWTKMTDIVPGDDRSNIVVDNGTASPHLGRIYVTYTDFAATGSSPDEIRLFYSDDGAVTWNGPINVSHVVGPGNAYPQSSQPRVANDGTVYVGFQYYPDGTYATAEDRIAKSTDGGLTFQPSVVISAGPNLQGGLNLGDQRGYFAVNAGCTTFRHRSFPIIGVDPTNSQHVYSMWAGGNLETPYSCGALNGVHSDILFSRSVDGGATWSAPLKVNDDPPGKDQYYPWMDVSANGKIWIGWHDRRDDPSNFRHAWYIDRSADGGLTFGTDHRVATVSSQPSDFIGDYAGLAVENNLMLSMWWDSRDTPTGDPYTHVIRLNS